MVQQITVCGEEIQLLPERALWWERKRSLIVADIHWGKSGHFRKHGFAMPAATQQADSQRLADIVCSYKAERLIVAGDLFHSRYNEEVESFTYWRNHHQSLEIDFIRGNHDILPITKYQKWRLNIFPDGMAADPFFIAHDKTDDPDRFTIHGHIHPGIRISGVRGGAVSLPCFCVNKTCMVLPAFGQFTGCKQVDIHDYDRLFVIGEGKVLALK